MREHGDEISKNMNCVVGYQVTELQGTKNEVTLLFDMRQKAGQKCLYLLPRKETAEKIAELGVSNKPDMCFVMTEKVFEQMGRKEMNGFFAFVSGAVGIQGNVMISNKFTNDVVNKYVPDCEY